ncbi:hypothetical protein [Lacticaseibacillus nasuensis]|uniref:hypothetical protein n=1 Tax=Lacticaseibacillus nasuensis TaxID=944671 RepID=UPI0012E331F8|nr:hypothetical protein [Lacticaseibacillus nasuensis]
MSKIGQFLRAFWEAKNPVRTQGSAANIKMIMETRRIERRVHHQFCGFAPEFTFNGAYFLSAHQGQILKTGAQG